MILAGNSITNRKTDQDIRVDIEEFYSTLRGYVPEARIAAAQIELRYNQAGNRHSTPCIEATTSIGKAKDEILLLSGQN